MRIKEHLKQLKPYQPGKPIEAVKSEYGLDKVVKLASNENPYGCSEAAKEALQHEIQQLALYPDGYSAALRTSSVSTSMSVKHHLFSETVQMKSFRSSAGHF